MSCTTYSFPSRLATRATAVSCRTVSEPSESRTSHRPHLPPGASARKLCITDDVLDHPQFQSRKNKNHKQQHNQQNSKLFGMQSTKSFDFEIPSMPTMMMGSTTAGLGEKTNELLAMAAVSLKENGITKMWDASQRDHHEEAEEEGLFGRDLQRLTYSRRDIQSIVYEDDQAFRTLQASLRQRGCITNAYLKENIHFYVRHVKDVRQKRLTEQAKQANQRRHRSMRQHTPHNAAA